MNAEVLKQNANAVLEDFVIQMRKHLSKLLQNKFHEYWPGEFQKNLRENSQKDFWNNGIRDGKSPEMMLDFGNFDVVFLSMKKELDLYKYPTYPTYLKEIRDFRNNVSHFSEFDATKARRAFENMRTISKDFGFTELSEKIGAILAEAESTKIEIAYTNNIEFSGHSLREDSPAPTWYQKGTLTEWHKFVYPVADIQAGVVNESVFAADIMAVVKKTGRPQYSDAKTFFQLSYLTAGLQSVALQVLRGLHSSSGGNSSITLQTGFGGGKTHTLITLYHLAKAGKNVAQLDGCEKLAENVVLTDAEINVAVFTNKTLDSTTGNHYPELGITTYTLWGELALQLGGIEAYKKVAENDKQRITPKGKMVDVLNSCKPALILIDELADYCVHASGIKVGDSNLSDQTISFAQELTEAINQVENCVLVATLPASATEVSSSEVGTSVLTSLENRFSRVSQDSKPVEDTEIFEVIRHRLFSDLGNKEIRQTVINKYVEFYLANKSEFPDEASKSEYKTLLEKAYPFHPELINIFKDRWASHPNFQRTRGVLQMLASIVAREYTKGKLGERPNQWLIHPGHVRINELDGLLGQIKRLFGNGYDAVVEADLGKNAYTIDSEMPNKPWVATDICNTLLMSSVKKEKDRHLGLSLKEIKLHVVRPNGYDHNVVHNAMDKLIDSAYYLYYSEAGTRNKQYWFDVRANINNIVNTAKEQVSMADRLEAIRVAIRAEIQVLESKNQGLRVFFEPSEFIEQKQFCLVFVSPELTGSNTELHTKTIEFIKNTATKRGTIDRQYRNTMLFVVARESQINTLKKTAQEIKARRQILEEYRGRLDTKDEQLLKEKLREFEESLRKRIPEAYSLLVKTESAAEIRAIPTDFSNAQMSVNYFARLLDKLRDEELMLDKSINFGLLKQQNLLPIDGAPKNIYSDVYEPFLKFDNFPYLLRDEVLSTSIRGFVSNGLLAVGVKEGGRLTKVFLNSEIPFFDVKNNSYYLLTVADAQLWIIQNMPKPTPPSGGETGGGTDPVPPSPGSDPNPAPKGDKPIPLPEPTPPKAKRFKKIKISGTGDITNASEITRSFLMPLKNNNVKFTIHIEAIDNTGSPLDANSVVVKLVEESSKQLGFNFEGEE